MKHVYTQHVYPAVGPGIEAEIEQPSEQPQPQDGRREPIAVGR